jgi:glutaredoxin 2
LERALTELDSYIKQLQSAEQYILQLQNELEELKNAETADNTINLNITIEELTAQIKELLSQISEITRQKQ